MFYLSKNKLHWNHKTKNIVILSVGNVHRVQRCMHSLFSLCLMQHGEEFLQWRMKCTPHYFVSVLLMCAGGFCTRSPSKPAKIEIRWRQIRRSRGPQVSINNATTKEFAQHLHCWIFCMRHSPILLKAAVLSVNFQKGNEIHNHFLVTFSCYRFDEENGTNYPPSRDSTPYSPTFKECNGLSCTVCGFSALRILLFWLLTYPLMWKHASSL
jgi:hypothetical protein